VYDLRQTLVYATIIRRLGIRNVAYVAWYRLGIKSGLRRKFFPVNRFAVSREFFGPTPTTLRTDYPEGWKAPLFEDARRIIAGRLRYYAKHWKCMGTPPEWFLNPFNGARYPHPHRHWTTLKDFHPKVGDIKNIWEASRFEWVVTLARAYAISASACYLQTLNQWLEDWATHNPVNVGPNWKCGQEASIRVFNLIQAALILNPVEEPTALLKDFVERHLERIHANIRYAIAQDNNHGTSEAAALFIGGHWLAHHAPLSRQSHNGIFYGRQGRRWLENRVARLVEKDGSFSQHSVTYHRMLLDTLIFTEFWRKKFKLAPFSQTFCGRAAAVLRWMTLFTDPHSGEAPNLGANDGTFVLNTHACDYRDFRPTLQTAALLFEGRRMFAHGPWDESCYWLGLKAPGIPAEERPKYSKVLPGGYVIMADRLSWAMLRYPMYRFRPSHNDVFHFDLWCRGVNICRDAGSYSYNPDIPAEGAGFSAVVSHNTVSFDGCEPMPRLGRFMLGRWLQPSFIGHLESLGNGAHRWSGAYQDHRGNGHRRTVTWGADTWTIEDHLSGPFKTARINYRLIAAAYRIAGHEVIAPWGRIEIEAADCRISMSKGQESLYYWHKDPVDVLTLDPARSSTKITVRFVLA
jgi:hypothetical protein